VIAAQLVKPRRFVYIAGAVLQSHDVPFV